MTSPVEGAPAPITPLMTAPSARRFVGKEPEPRARFLATITSADELISAWT